MPKKKKKGLEHFTLPRILRKVKQYGFDKQAVEERMMLYTNGLLSHQYGLLAKRFHDHYIQTLLPALPDRDHISIRDYCNKKRNWFTSLRNIKKHLPPEIVSVISNLMWILRWLAFIPSVQAQYQTQFRQDIYTMTRMFDTYSPRYVRQQDMEPM